MATGNVDKQRELLLRLTFQLQENGQEGLAEIAEEAYRLSFRDLHKTRAKPKSAKLTPDLKEEIRAYTQAHPEEHDRDIGPRFNVNHGRVSQIRSGEL
jgi:hypothetical protein